MSSEDTRVPAESCGRLSRRDLLAVSAAAGEAARRDAGGPLARSGKTCDMKKSINPWAFPYPDRMNLRQCFELAKRAGFDGIEVNFDLENDLSPKASDEDLRAIGKMARDIGIKISGMCTFLYWPYPFTADDPKVRARALELAGNIMFFQFPQDYIPQLGKRIRNVHLKEYTKKGTDFSIESFRPLLDGTTDWPAVMEAFDKVGYRGYLTFEYFHPFAHYPEALIYHTSDALDRLLGGTT